MRRSLFTTKRPDIPLSDVSGTRNGIDPPKVGGLGEERLVKVEEVLLLYTLIFGRLWSGFGNGVFLSSKVESCFLRVTSLKPNEV